MSNHDANLWSLLEHQLHPYPNFRTLLPGDYPRAESYGITAKTMKWYSDNRDSKMWQHFNLPMLLYSVEYGIDSKVKDLSSSILEAFEEFSKTFSTLPGVTKTLTPLWKTPWDLADPTFWSVVGEVFMALHAKTKAGLEILGFAQPIGGGGKNADIRAKHRGTITHIDVTMGHLTKIIEGDITAFRKLVEDRGKTKLQNKFKDLPEGENGIVALIFVIQRDNLDRFKTEVDATDPVYLDSGKKNPFAQVYWLVGGTKDGKFGFHIIDKSVEVI